MKTKNISKETYIKTYCKDQRIRSRQTVYVSTAVHNQLRDLADALRFTHTSTASLVDTILTHHLESHKEVIAELVGEAKPKTPPKVSPVKPEIPPKVEAVKAAEPPTKRGAAVTQEELNKIYNV